MRRPLDWTGPGWAPAVTLQDSPLTSPRGQASGYPWYTVWWSRRLATGWMVGSSPRCADSFSPTKSRNRLSDASLGPDWCTVVHQVRVLSVFLPSSFFSTLRECPNTICGLKLIFGICRHRGIPVGWGAVSSVVDHLLSRRCGKGFIFTFRHST